MESPSGSNFGYFVWEVAKTISHTEHKSTSLKWDLGPGRDLLSITFHKNVRAAMDSTPGSSSYSLIPSPVELLQSNKSSKRGINHENQKDSPKADCLCERFV